MRELLPEGALDRAYAAQEINTKRWLAAGRAPRGRKIGLTSLAVQKQLGVDQPDYGMLFDDMAIPDGWEIGRKQLIQPKVEAEIAFVLGSDLDHERLTMADVIRAVDFALPAIEVVDTRIADWKIGILDTIADNASSGLYVLGARRSAVGRAATRRQVMAHQGQTGLWAPGPPVSAIRCGEALAGANHGARGRAAEDGPDHAFRRARDRWSAVPGGGA